MDFIQKIKKQAKKNQKIIAFPEWPDLRIIKAIEIIQKEKIAIPALIGEKDLIIKKTPRHYKINWSKITFLQDTPAKKKTLAKKLHKLREKKGMTLALALTLVEDSNYFAILNLMQNEIDGIVTGATKSTADSIRPALQLLRKKNHRVSGAFFMLFKDKTMIFADCAVNIEPDEHQLAEIAIDSAKTAIRFGIKPKVALLSFSTNGSTEHEKAVIIKNALKIVKEKHTDLIIDGEMQADAALVPRVSDFKFPGNTIKGNANVLIFPDLNSGNIGYKLVERLAGAKAIGPLLQGLSKPVNDLSRGCDAEDIVNMTALTACEAANNSTRK